MPGTDTEDKDCNKNHYELYCKNRFDTGADKMDELTKDFSEFRGEFNSELRNIHASQKALVKQLGNGGGLQEQSVRHDERLGVVESKLKIQPQNASLAKARVVLVSKVIGAVTAFILVIAGVDHGVPIITGEVDTQKELVTVVEENQDTMRQIQKQLAEFAEVR
jgi:hypothetical protein